MCVAVTRRLSNNFREICRGKLYVVGACIWEGSHNSQTRSGWMLYAADSAACGTLLVFVVDNACYCHLQRDCFREELERGRG